MKIKFVTFFSKRWGWLSLWTICALLFVLFVMIMSWANVHPWSDVSAERVAWYHQEQCETVRVSSFFLQFYNLWSNLAYLAGGLLIVWLSTSGIGRAFGVVLIVLAVGSGWFHGSLTRSGQISDVVSVYCAMTSIIAFGLIEMVPLEEKGYAARMCFAVALLLGLSAGMLRHRLWFFNSDYFMPFLAGLLVLCMAMTAIRGGKDKEPLLGPFIGSTMAGLLALISNFTDGDRNIFARYGGDYSKCAYNPTGLIQGHSVWHLLTAMMFISVFEYLRSVRSRTQSIWPWRVVR